MSGQHAQVGVWLEASLQIAWFLCGSMWFLRGTYFCKRWFGAGETSDSAAVPVWFHVVPYLECVPKYVFRQRPTPWFLRGSMWFLRGTCFCKRWVGAGETPDSAVVPVWFHVVPYLEGVPK